MAYRQQRLGLLMRLNIEQARVEIVRALRASEGKLGPAAKALGVSDQSLSRYVRALADWGAPVPADLVPIVGRPPGEKRGGAPRRERARKERVAAA